MAAWTAEKITADAAQNMQIGAGLLLRNFDIESAKEPADEDIICNTTGDYTITCVPETSDIFEDVNNAPVNTMEGKRIDGWTCGLSIESLTFSPEALKFALGAADITEGNDGVNPRRQYKLSDFANIYWVGDMLGEEDKLLVVAMDNTVSTGGISITTTNRGKGRMALDITPHVSAANQDKIPMAFYILTKGAATPATASTNLSSLEIDGLELVPEFSPKRTYYYAEAEDGISNSIIAVAEDSEATVTIASDDATIGTGDTANWREGGNVVYVTVENGGDRKIYTLFVNAISE